MTKETKQLNSLEQALDKAEKKDKVEAVKEKGQEQKERRRLQAAKRLEAKYANEKRVLAKKIYSWAGKFSQTDNYCHLNKYYEEGLEVFCSGWGHEIPYACTFGCWSRLRLKPDGSFVYGAGYRSHGISTRFLLKTPKELKDKLCYEYLKEFARTIKSLEVYAYIRQ